MSFLLLDCFYYQGPRLCSASNVYRGYQEMVLFSAHDDPEGSRCDFAHLLRFSNRLRRSCYHLLQATKAEHWPYSFYVHLVAAAW